MQITIITHRHSTTQRQTAVNAFYSARILTADETGQHTGFIGEQNEFADAYNKYQSNQIPVQRLCKSHFHFVHFFKFAFLCLSNWLTILQGRARFSCTHTVTSSGSMLMLILWQMQMPAHICHV